MEDDSLSIWDPGRFSGPHPRPRKRFKVAYSKAEKEAILARYHASGLSVRAACRLHLDFPCRPTLHEWIKLEEAGALTPDPIKVRGRCEHHVDRHPYPTNTKLEAVRLLKKGWGPNQIARRLNVKSACAVTLWGRNAAATGDPTPTICSDALKKKALDRFSQGERVADIAAGLGINHTVVYRWAKRAGIARPQQRERRANGKAGVSVGAEQDNGGEPGAWARAWGDLPDDPDERARVAEVRLAEALAVLDVLKAPGPSSLTNSEKHRAGQMARKKAARARLSDILADFGASKSTYLSQARLADRPDRYAALRGRVKREFDKAHGRYGSESIWQALRRGTGACVKAAGLTLGDEATPVKVSEKVVRRIMAEEGLVPVQAKSARNRFASYAGETDGRPANLPLLEDGTHDFHADAPGDLIVTDVTEFKLPGLKLPGFKLYFSPAIDCFDGDVVTWAISEHPDDDLTAGMLEDAIPMLSPGATMHSDGGANYRSSRWKALCADNGLVRSMSRKAKSPDNARAEGFFGTLKQEFFYARDWHGVSKEKFIELLEGYLVWYRDEKIKKSLGWKTIKEHRASLGEAA